MEYVCGHLEEECPQPPGLHRGGPHGETHTKTEGV